MGSAAFYMFWALCAAIALNANSRHLTAVDDVKDDNSIYQKYVELDKFLKGFVNTGVKNILPYIMEGSEHINMSSSCARDVLRLISDVRKLKLSAFKLLDASTKVPVGILNGNIFLFGDYDECMDTTATRNDGSIAFRGEYCMVYVNPILPRRRGLVTMQSGLKEFQEATKNTSELMQYIASMLHYSYYYSVKFGICVPSGCSSEDIGSVLKYVGEKVMVNATVGYCDQHHDKTYSTGAIVAIFFFSFFGLLSIIGTSLDYYSKAKKVTFQNQIVKLMLCFSILTNFPKIISTKISDKSLSSVFGIRALSLFYIVLMHHYFFIEKFNVLGHMLVFKDQIPGFFMQIIINGFLTTEVFFFIGGFFHSYSSMKFLEKSKQKINYVAVIIHRLLRIYPPYLFCMMSIYILSNVQGPIATLISKTYWEKCDKTWWHNLLFINNFFVQEETCMFHSWYIAADMQLFLISLFTVPVFAKSAKKGITLHTGILIAGLLSTSLWAWYKDILPALVVSHVNSDEINRVWDAYTTTFPHIAPYFAGLLIGYFLSTFKDFKISLVCRIIGWPIAAVAFTSMLFMTQRWNSGIEPTVMESALYFSFSRLIYVLVIGWMIVCCARGYGGILNYILSLKVWVPIARISYMMYLMSPIIQVVYVSHLRIPADNDDVSLIWRYFGDLGVSFLIALVMSTLIESPFIALEKIIFRRKSTEGTKDNENSNQAQIYNINEEKCQKAVELENNFKNTILDLNLKQ